MDVDMIEFITLLIFGLIGYGFGVVIGYIFRTPEKKVEVREINPKVNEKEWKKCMKGCGAYYQDNGKIWDNETAVIAQQTCYDGYVEKPKRIKHGKCKTNPNDPGKPYSECNKNVKKKKKKKNDSRLKGTKTNNSKTKR